MSVVSILFYSLWNKSSYFYHFTISLFLASFHYSISVHLLPFLSYYTFLYIHSTLTFSLHCSALLQYLSNFPLFHHIFLFPCNTCLPLSRISVIFSHPSIFSLLSHNTAVHHLFSNLLLLLHFSFTRPCCCILFSPLFHISSCTFIFSTYSFPFFFSLHYNFPQFHYSVMFLLSYPFSFSFSSRPPTSALNHLS